MRRLIFPAVAVLLGFGSARGSDPDLARVKLELVRQQMFLDIERAGTSAQLDLAGGASGVAASARLREESDRIRARGQAEFNRILNGDPKPTPLSEKRSLLTGTWRGSARFPDGNTGHFELTVNEWGLMSNSITVTGPTGALVSQSLFNAQMSYYKDGVVYLTDLSGASQDLKQLEWKGDNRFTLTTPGSHVSTYDRVR